MDKTKTDIPKTYTGLNPFETNDNAQVLRFMDKSENLQNELHKMIDTCKNNNQKLEYNDVTTAYFLAKLGELFVMIEDLKINLPSR